MDLCAEEYLASNPVLIKAVSMGVDGASIEMVGSSIRGVHAVPTDAAGAQDAINNVR